jgi:hypothetical protein
MYDVGAMSPLSWGYLYSGNMQFLQKREGNVHYTSIKPLITESYTSKAFRATT